MSIDRFRAALRKDCDKAGSYSAWAEAHGVTRSYVSQVLNMGAKPGPSLVAALGWRRVVSYEPVRPTRARRG